MESHQLVLPLEYHEAVLHMLHDDYGHQGLDWTLALVGERFYWSTMNHDAAKYVTNCHWCHVAKDHYTGPYTQQGSLVPNNPLDLLCIDFLKVDPSRDGKENILVLTDDVTKFSQAFITNNQKALTVAKILVKKWFYVYEPYELMFGLKAPTICDSWLGLAQYNDQASTNKCTWLNEQHELLMSANGQALKHIKQSAKKSQIRTGGKTLQIPVRSLVLLRDHPEGHNKIQDNYKSELFIVVDHHKDPNVYIIQSLDKKGPKKTVV